MRKETKLKQLYHEIFRDASLYEKRFNIQMVAATYMAIAMRLYKTNLTDKAYRHMIETVMKTEVKPYKNSKDTIH